MREVRPDAALLRQWLERDGPGPGAIVGHVVSTGYGRCWVDEPSAPTALLAETAGNYLLAGEPGAVDPALLRPIVTGFLGADAGFAPVLAAAFPDLVTWDRVIYRGGGGAPAGPPPANLRRLAAADADAVHALSEPLGWISKTWGGPAGLAASGYAWGAFAGARLVALACTFFLGVRHEEIGVMTEPEYRGQGLSTACARAVCGDIVARGRVPSWTTAPDNIASRRVAEKAGFRFIGPDLLYAIGVALP